jgi:hypothetical protein
MPANSEKQRNYFQLVALCQNKGDCKSQKIKDTAQSMSKKAVHDFASTPDKDLPEFNLNFLEFLKMEESKTNCECPCASCMSGNCGGCTCENCTCKGCHCNSKG